MNLNNKYNLGDKVFYISSEGTLKVGTINAIMATVMIEGIRISYGMTGQSYTGVTEEKMFSTKEDAITYFTSTAE